MDFFMLTFMFCILWSQIEAEKVCPNNFSYIYGDKCYSMDVDIKYKYSHAVEFCQKQGAILWSRTSNEELEFLKKVHTKLRRLYWVGIRQVGLNWQYLSDDSLGSYSLFYKLRSAGTYCQYIETKGETGSIGCNHEIYAVCEYIGEACAAKKYEGMDCYEFTDTPINFTNAAKTCKLFGGRLAEYRDQNQLLQIRETLLRYNAIDIPIEKIKVSMGSWFPTIWNFQHELQHHKSCETYLLNTIQKEDCEKGYNFVCKLDAVGNANDYPNSSKPCTELGTQEGTSESVKSLPMNKTQGIWRLDHNNNSLDVTNITVIAVGAIIIVVLIITVIIQIKIMRRKKDMYAAVSSNSNESANTVQNNNTQRSLPERPNRSYHYDDVDINVEMRSFPARHREVSLQHHYTDITETVVPQQNGEH